MKMFVSATALLLAAVASFPTASAAAATTPAAALDELLAADRTFATASASTDLISGVSAMLADNASMPLPGGRNAFGRAQVIDALRGNPDNATAHLEWSPVRGGLSADGLHGFTFGYMTVRKSDGTTTPGKYLSYWIKGTDGWRVAAYKRRPATNAGAVVMMPPALPAALVSPSADPKTIAKHEHSLDAAERAFSDEAQHIGLGPAFAKYGSADAVNMGGPDDSAFVLGSEAIARAVSAGGPPTGSTVSWAPEKVFVASSGDLGVTIGVITDNQPAADGSAPKSYSFFTVWHRANPKAPWRYIAE